MRSVASLVLLLASCAACGAAVGETVPFSTLGKGINSGIREPAQVVVRSQSEWVALWGRHLRTRTAPPPPPAVDFTTEMVVALFLGERSTGGYEIEVTQVERTDPGLAVRFRVKKPDPGAMPMQVLTQPFHLIKLPRVDESLTFSAENPSR
jgi:protease stability complex PrcB-like protein